MTDAQPDSDAELGPSTEAVAIATDLIGRYEDMALGRARMQLYAALNDRTPLKVDLLSQVCFIIMERTVFIPISDDNTMY
ncbi:MAG: hypothetical protein EOO77_01585 [Oxalobacteraceae bacterium]|nr:MAG: hypothetical protein EOO77_01585 [Oxalobacteraceae bacterium]